MKKAKIKARQRIYRQSPEFKAKRNLHNQIPEVKARVKAKRQTPEAKAKEKLHYQLPEVKARKQSPEAKAKVNLRNQSPKRRAKRVAYAIAYNVDPVNKARARKNAYCLLHSCRRSICTDCMSTDKAIQKGLMCIICREIKTKHYICNTCTTECRDNKKLRIEAIVG